MRTKLLLSLLLFIGILSVPTSAIELRINRERVSEANPYESDYLFVGQKLDFGGKAKDLFFFGQQSDFYGALEYAFIGLGQILNIKGEVNNGVKAGGQIISLDANVTGTSFLAGQEINIESSARLNGDTFIAGGRANIYGPIIGNLYVAAGEVLIENEIKGDTQIRAGKIQLAENARIVGDLKYFADQKLKPEDLKKVTGNIQFVQSDMEFPHKHVDHEKMKPPFWLGVFLKISLAIVGFMLLLLPVSKGLRKQFEIRNFLSLFLWGLVPYLIYPTLVILLTLMVITIPLSLALILAAFPILLITKTIGLTLIGGYLAGLLKLKTNNRFLYYLIAIIPYSILSAIPFLGYVFLFIVMSIGWGMMLSWMVNKQLAVRITD